MTVKRCDQCGQRKPWPESFIGKRGKPVNWCQICSKRYRNWGKKTTAEKLAIPRVGVPNLGELRARLIVSSGNRKLGGIPASITSRLTCPSSCSFYGKGCFAEYSPLAFHWRNVGTKGDSWEDFCDDVAKLPKGTLWRHNVAGDLPGDGMSLSVAGLEALVRANRGKRGFTFTHVRVAGHILHHRLVAKAIAGGFTINLSADSLGEADRLAMCGFPVAVVLPHDTPGRSLRTPGGRRVTICPAETPAALTCAECQLCAVPTRKTIVGFLSHGQSKKLVSEIVRTRTMGTTRRGTFDGRPERSRCRTRDEPGACKHSARSTVSSDGLKSLACTPKRSSIGSAYLSGPRRWL